MATIYISSGHINDGYVYKFDADWSTARDATSGTASVLTSRAPTGVGAARYASRGGGYSYRVYRSFFFFDTSGISTDVSSATFKVYGYSAGNGDLIAVKSNASSPVHGTDLDAIVGWDGSSSDGSGGGDNESNVTKYSSEISTWSTSGYNDITLNAQALTDMRDDSAIVICLINFDYDLKDIIPTGYSDNRCGLYYTDWTGTSLDPYIDYTLAPTTTDNAIFFGTNF